MLLSPLPKCLRKAWPRAVLQHQMALLPEETRRRPELQAQEKLVESSKAGKWTTFCLNISQHCSERLPQCSCSTASPKVQIRASNPPGRKCCEEPSSSTGQCVKRCPVPTGPKEWLQRPGEHLTMQVKAMALLLLWQHLISSKGDAFDC